MRRVAWEITYGAPPPRIQITTTCKTKLCCNPDHLTYRAGDRESPHAEAFGRTRFTKRDKKRIQKQHSDGMSLYELRSRWNANTATLLHILKNQT